MPVSGELRPLHASVVPESIRQPLGSWSVSVPVVVVPSVYVPSDFAVQVPVTWRDPLIDTFWQVAGERPAAVVSRLLLLMSRQEELTFQVPTTLPPQAETFVHAWELPPEPLEPPLCELPPEPFDPPLCELPPEPV